MTGQVDVIEILTADHELLRDLADQLEAAERPADMRRIYLRIVELFAAHEAAEEDVVLPAFRAAEPAEVATASARAGEHEEVDELLDEMRSLAPDGYAFAKRASALALDLRAHLDNEEELVFPRLRSRLNAAQLAELGRRFLAAKDRAPVFHHAHHASVLP